MGFDVELERVERVLQLNDQFVSKGQAVSRQTRGLQIGNRRDLVSPRLDSYMLQVPPGRFFLLLVLLRQYLAGKSEPALHEAWKAVFFQHADPIKIVVTAVLLGCLRMENVRALQPELLRDYFLYIFGSHRAALLSKLRAEIGDDLFVSHVLKRHQVLPHANRLADTDTAPGAHRGDGFVLRDPIGARLDSSIAPHEEPVVPQRQRRQTKASSRRGLEGPSGEHRLELAV